MAATYHQWEAPRDQLKYWGGALLIHALIGALLIGFNWRSGEVVVPQLAINAVVVDRNTLNQLVRQQAAPAPSAPVEPDKSEQEELEKQRQEQERLKQEQLQQEQLKQEQAQREQLELQRVQEQQRLAEAEKQKQLELQRRAEQAEQQRQKQEAEKKRLADIQQKQREAEQKRQADAEARAQAAREAELKAQMAAEEGRAEAVNSGLLNQYVALIQQKVMRNWIKPDTARSGLACEVSVTQATGGTVLSVDVGKCNGDAAVRASIEAAVRRADPLPAPPDPRLFQRNLLFVFKPTE